MNLPRLREFWGQCSFRERVLVAGGAVVVALAMLYFFLWQPGIAATRRLSAALPAMHAQVALMRAQQAEIAVLRKGAGDAPSGVDLKAALEASLARAPFARSVQRVEAVSAERVTVSVGATSFDDWLRWVSAAQRASRARLEKSSIAALPESGMVRVEASFLGPAAEKR